MAAHKGVVSVSILVISEDESRRLITWPMAFEAVRRALIAATAPDTVSFPSVIAHGSKRTNRFSIKSATTPDLAGLKVGSFWSGNTEIGLPRHNSLILLLDQSVGRIHAAIEAGYVNAVRTSAANALAADALARPDAKVVTIFGSGNQAYFECTAIAQVRQIEKVHVVARNGESAAQLCSKLSALGVTAVQTPPEEACGLADIIVTATPSTAPLFQSCWVNAGTYVAAMGSDAKGKQELPIELLSRSQLFCDLPSQSVQMGEMQHISDEIAAGTACLRPIGEILRAPEAYSATADVDAVKVFDSSGIALQDLYVATALLNAYGTSRA